MGEMLAGVIIGGVNVKIKHRISNYGSRTRISGINASVQFVKQYA